MNTRFDRINDDIQQKPKKTRKPKPVPEPLDTRTVREKIDAGVYSTEKVMPWPGKDPVARKKYYRIQGELLAKFKADLIAENYATNYPKADLCYEKAWEHGHSAGLHEVVTYFEDFVELLSPA